MIIVDYKREIRRLNQLPELKAILLRLIKMDKGLVFIDDLARIFRRTPIGCRAELLLDLQEFAQRLYSVRHGAKLSDFSDQQTRVLLMHVEKVKLARVTLSPRDTSAARAASVASRSSRSKALHKKIMALRSELMAANGTVTLQAIADEANKIEPRTSTGRKWTRQAIKKALDGSLRSEAD